MFVPVRGRGREERGRPKQGGHADWLLRLGTAKLTRSTKRSRCGTYKHRQSGHKMKRKLPEKGPYSGERLPPEFQTLVRALASGGSLRLPERMGPLGEASLRTLLGPGARDGCCGSRLRPGPPGCPEVGGAAGGGLRRAESGRAGTAGWPPP